MSFLLLQTRGSKLKTKRSILFCDPQVVSHGAKRLGGLDSFRFKDRLKELSVCSTTEKSLLIMWNYLQQRKTEEEKKQVEETYKRISPFLLP